jgi:hypothetical protein
MIRNNTIRMGLGLIPIKQTNQLAKLRWFGSVVRMGDKRYPKARIQGKRSKGPSRLGKKGYTRF